jgi:nucleolar protein 6
MGKSSKKRTRTDEDVADVDAAAKPLVKKSKLETSNDPGADVAEKAKSKSKDKKDKKKKKEKKSKSESTTEDAANGVAPEAGSKEETEPPAEAPVNGSSATDEKATKKQKKKDKKKKNKSKDADANNNEDDEHAADDAEAGHDNANPNSIPLNGNNHHEGKQPRFICFIGNLPYTATAEAVRKHFASLEPTSVRLLTQRDDPSKSRGIAFVEFDRYDRMKTCLAKFHHTEFDDGISPKRRINVELTYVFFIFSSPCSRMPLSYQERPMLTYNATHIYSAGGGGKTPSRIEKIKQKNAKLNEERAARMKREEEEKAKKEKQQAAASSSSAGNTAEPEKTQEQRDEEDIHPSRRGIVPYKEGQAQAQQQEQQQWNDAGVHPSRKGNFKGGNNKFGGNKRFGGNHNKFGGKKKQWK